MSLGLSAYHGSSEGGGNSFRLRVEYNSKAGRMFRVDRAQDASGSYSNSKVDITMSQPEFAIDMGSIQVGFFHFPPGSPPSKELVYLGERMPVKPSPDHKAGFQVLIYNPKDMGEEAREFSASAGATVNALEDLHAQFLAAPEAKEGKIPVIKVTDHQPIQSKHGTNYKPVFTIIRWTARKEEVFGPRTVPAPGASIPALAPSGIDYAAASAAAKSAPPANHVPPPAPTSAPAAAAMPSEW